MVKLSCPIKQDALKDGGKCSGYKRILLNREKKVTKIITFIQRASACLSMDVTLFQFFCDKTKKKIGHVFRSNSRS